MNDDSLTADLLALAQTAPADPSRSKAARLRAVLAAVEAALAAGTSREKVLETLRAHGLDMTLAVFNTTLRRVRAAHTMAGDKAAPALAVTPGAAVTPPRIPPAPVASLHAPSEPDMNQSEPVDMNHLINLGKGRDKK